MPPFCLHLADQRPLDGHEYFLEGHINSFAIGFKALGDLPPSSHPSLILQYVPTNDHLPSTLLLFAFKKKSSCTPRALACATASTWNSLSTEVIPQSLHRVGHFSFFMSKLQCHSSERSSLASLLFPPVTSLSPCLVYTFYSKTLTIYNYFNYCKIHEGRYHVCLVFSSAVFIQVQEVECVT